MKRFFMTACCILLCAAMLSGTVAVYAEQSDDDYILVTPDYIENVLKEQLRKELLGEGQLGQYHDAELTNGQIIALGEDCEIICRSTGVSAITTATGEGNGLADLSDGTEIFSGTSLTPGKMYFGGQNGSGKYILITGEKATLTLKGNYEII